MNAHVRVWVSIAQGMACTASDDVMASDDVHAATELHVQLEHFKDRAAIYKVPAHLAPLSLAVQRLHGEDCCSTGACVRTCLRKRIHSHRPDGAYTIAPRLHRPHGSPGQTPAVCKEKPAGDTSVSSVRCGAGPRAAQLKRGMGRGCGRQCAPTRWPRLPPGDRLLLAGACTCVVCAGFWPCTDARCAIMLRALCCQNVSLNAQVTRLE